jgi:excisionase family DNA binding protein
MNPVLKSEWLTAAEAALYLKVQTRTVLLWARQGKLRGYALSGAKRHVWRFRVADLDGMMTVPSVALRNGRIQ